MTFSNSPYGADDMWATASGETEQAQTQQAMAHAMARTASLTEVLYSAASEADLDNRLSLVAGKLAQAADESGADLQTLVDTHRRQALLAVEATHRYAPKTASVAKEAVFFATHPSGYRAEYHGGSRYHITHESVPDHTVDSPVIPGYDHSMNADEAEQAMRAMTQKKLTNGLHDWAKENGGDYMEHDLQYRHGSKNPLERIAAIKRALEEGENPLAWVPAVNGQQSGEGEKPSISGNEAFNEGDYVTPGEEGGAAPKA